MVRQISLLGEEAAAVWGEKGAALQVQQRPLPVQELPAVLSAWAAGMDRQGEPVLVFERDGAVAASMQKEYRSAVLASIVEHMDPELFRSVQWARGTIYPAPSSLEAFGSFDGCGLGRVRPEVRRIMFLDDSSATELERADRIMPGVRRVGQEG